MKIRSISCFIDPSTEALDTAIEHRARFARHATLALNQAGYEVQTIRLVTTPFPRWFKALDAASAVRQAVEFEQIAAEYQFSYQAIGPALPEFPQSYAVIPDILAATRNMSVSGLMATRQSGISLPAVKACARVIYQAAPLTPDGFTNFRFGAIANMPPYGPFFPSAYAGGPEAAFSLAVESADLAITAFQQANTLEACRRNLLDTLEDNSRRIQETAERLALEHAIEFKGIDISLAPYPENWCSIGKALELLGPISVGLSGSLAAAAFIADTLDMGTWKKVGFNGLILPVLEDSVLGRCSSDGTLTLRDLLLLSTVCGAGLDTVPLPGDANIEQLTAVLLDVAALANRLGKPLTARLIPVPGKKAGEATGFDFSYFVNGTILDLPALPLSGPLAGNETFILHPRTNPV